MRAAINRHSFKIVLPSAGGIASARVLQRTRRAIRFSPCHRQPRFRIGRSYGSSPSASAAPRQVYSASRYKRHDAADGDLSSAPMKQDLDCFDFELAEATHRD